ncbi:pantoate--beta-alanine ligase [Leucobacter luti]|uniref:pantoate--beta-alanine ligase n=1 Tax=Leucobacter luti TaxID=340320 RepID=UPI003CFDC01D
MRIVRTIAQLRKEVAGARARGSEVGMVPTMGALHDGHLSLVHAARADQGFVVMSIFVNPTQFTEAEDLEAYPRQEASDAALAEAAGVDVIFAPTAAEMYPEGFATTVHVGGSITERLEGETRGAAHFDGVATVVSKLLLACMPDRAYFGEKDAQQVLVVSRMVRDLGIPVRIVPCPTSRDEDGLARSSRNARLSEGERARALAIPRALGAAAAALASGECEAEAIREAAGRELAAEDLVAEYLAIVDPDTLDAVERVDAPALLAIAVRVGEVRLIDNAVLTP